MKLVYIHEMLIKKLTRLIMSKPLFLINESIRTFSKSATIILRLSRMEHILAIVIAVAYCVHEPLIGYLHLALLSVKYLKKSSLDV